MFRFFVRFFSALTSALVLLVLSSGCQGGSPAELPVSSAPPETGVMASSDVSKATATTASKSAELTTTTKTIASPTTRIKVSTTQKSIHKTVVKSNQTSSATSATSTQQTTTTAPQTSTTEFPINPDTGQYEVQIPPIHFHYESTDYKVFYDAIAKYCGPTITDKFDVIFHNQGSHLDPNTKELVIRSYYLSFGTEINGCRSNEIFHFSFDLVDGVYVCESISIKKPTYDPSKVKAPRKFTAKEEKAALKSERERILAMPYEGETVEDNYYIDYQKVKYFYDIEKDRNYCEIITHILDKKGMGIGDYITTEVEIKR